MTKIKLHIGPNIDVLIGPDETPQQAFIRHKNIIIAFPPINTAQELNARLAAYPDYHFSKTVNDADFARVIKLGVMLRAFSRDFPAHVDKVIERILTNDIDFARIVTGTDGLIDFARAFPTHVDKVIERILTNDIDFARVIPSGPWTLSEFTSRFPTHVNGVIERILTNDTDFARMIPNKYALEDFAEHFPAYADRAREKFELKMEESQEAKTQQIATSSFFHNQRTANEPLSGNVLSEAAALPAEGEKSEKRNDDHAMMYRNY